MTPGRAPRLAAALLAALLLPACAGLRQGFDLEHKRVPDDEYHWARELYEVPLGLVGTPLLILLVPIDMLDSWRRMPLRFGHNSALWLTFLDPTHNVRWGAFPDPK